MQTLPLLYEPPMCMASHVPPLVLQIHVVPDCMHISHGQLHAVASMIEECGCMAGHHIPHGAGEDQAGSFITGPVQRHGRLYTQCSQVRGLQSLL